MKYGIIYKLLVTVIVLSTSVDTLKAQSVTYNHDSSVMNQFTIGEIGAGIVS